MTVVAPLPTEQLETLLPVLGSDQPGEVAAAAAAITRTLRAAGHDWHSLAAAIAGHEQQRVGESIGEIQRQRNLVDAMVQQLTIDDRANLVTDWECNFIHSIKAKLYKRKFPLSEKQLAVLLRIADRLGVRA